MLSLIQSQKPSSAASHCPKRREECLPTHQDPHTRSSKQQPDSSCLTNALPTFCVDYVLFFLARLELQVE